MRRAGALAAVSLLLVAGFTAEGQEPASRLDRVFHGLAYRALSDGTAPEATKAADAGGVRSPHEPAVLYRIDERVHRSDDRGDTWSAVSPALAAAPLTAISESPVEPGLIWVGAADGSVHLTRDGGLSWSRVTTLPEELAGGTVRELVASGYRGGSAYALLDPRPGRDPEPLLFRTDDYGGSWEALSGPGRGLVEDAPLTAFVEDPEGSGLLFVGTSYGVHVSFDDGGSWDLFRLGMPEATVTGLGIVDRDLVVRTRDRGRFVMDEIGPLRQVMRGLLTGEPYLFEPSPVAVGDGRSAAFVDYLLPSFVRHVRVEVLDRDGDRVATVRGDERPPDGERLPGTRAGVHRVTWDLTRTGEGGARHLVAPGLYTVRMTVDGLVRERSLEILAPGPDNRRTAARHATTRPPSPDAPRASAPRPPPAPGRAPPPAAPRPPRRTASAA